MRAWTEHALDTRVLVLALVHAREYVGPIIAPVAKQWQD